MVIPGSSFEQTMMGPKSPMLHTKFRGKRPPAVPEKKSFEGFLPYMGMVTILSCDPRSGSLNVSYHKEQEYIWFRGGDPNGF